MKSLILFVVLLIGLSGCCSPTAPRSSAYSRPTPSSRAFYTFDKSGNIVSKTTYHHYNDGTVLRKYERFD